MTVETQVWEPATDRPQGYLRLVRQRTVGEVYADLKRHLPQIGDGYVFGAEEYFSPSATLRSNDAEWPAGQVVVYAVTGGSEGHYVHVSVITEGAHVGDIVPVITGKTFEGADAAQFLVNRLARILEVCS